MNANAWTRPSIYWLLAFFPVALALEHAHAAAPLVFFSAALAIIPAASLIVHSTEGVAEHTGDAVGGLLNATFGNLPELIVAMVALKAGLFDMVRASLIGAVLANLLLFLGTAFFLGGLRHHQQDYSPAATRIYSTMMLIAVISLMVPSSFSRLFGSGETVRHEQLLNLGTAFVLLGAYALYLLFMLRTHADLFASSKADAPHGAKGERASLPWSIGGLVLGSVLAAWTSEILVGAAQATGEALGMSEVFIGVVVLAIVGGPAGGGSVIAMARKNRVDLSMGIALGSSIQIALFVAPVLVLASYFVAQQPLALAFSRPELGALLFAVLIGAMAAGDGHANWFKGVQLVTVYVMMALMFYFMPALPA
jgi:Ca2+:H+ antiporter